VSEQSTAGGHPTDRTPRDPNWSTRIALVLVTLVLLALAVVLAVNLLPSWWAHRVGEVSDGKFTSATFAGLTCGFVFTAAPLLMTRRVFARHGSLVSRVVWLLLAALVAAPNLTTLAIVVGTGDAAHAAERTFDVEAPGFRNATAIGAAVAVVFVVMLWFLLAGRRRRGRQLRDAETELERLRSEVRRREQELSDGDAPTPRSGPNPTAAPSERPDRLTPEGGPVDNRNGD